VGGNTLLWIWPLAADWELLRMGHSLLTRRGGPMLEIINTPAFARIPAVKIYLRCIKLEVRTHGSR